MEDEEREERRKQSQLKWRRANKDKINGYRSNWREPNRERYNAYMRAYNANRREAYNAYMREYRNKQRAKESAEQDRKDAKRENDQP